MCRHLQLQLKKMDAYREEKQKYLRENILEKDYDAEEFMDFCENYHGNVDIDNWTLWELTETVQKFIESNTTTIKKSPFQYNPDLHKESSGNSTKQIDWDNQFVPQIQERKELDLNPIDFDFLMGLGTESNNKKIQIKSKPSPQKKELVGPQKTMAVQRDIVSKLQDKNNQFIVAYNSTAFNNGGNSPTFNSNKTVDEKQERQEAPKIILLPVLKDAQYVEQTIKTTLKCKSFSNKPKLQGDYQIVVSGHQIVNPNIFVPNFVLFHITTNPLNVEVKRRMKDFQMFRNILKKIFPSTQLPHLERYGRLSETEPNVIKKQKLFIESFMNNLMMNKNIRCKIIDDFLMCQNLENMKKIFREYQKLEKPKCIEDLYTTEGSIDLNFSSPNKKYLAQQALYLEYLEPSIMKLKNLYDQLILSFANNVKIIQQIGSIYDNLKDNTKNVNNIFSEEYQTSSLVSAFDQVSQIHKQWALSLKTQSKILQAEVRHLYRFEIDNVGTIKEVHKTTENIVEAYEKRSDKDQSSKETYEYNKRLNDFKVAVENPSKNTTVLRYQAAYFQEHTVAETKRYLNELSEKIKNKFKIFSVLQLNISHDLEGAWRQFQKFAS